MAKTQAEQQIEILKQMKAGKAVGAAPDASSDAPPEVSPKPAPRKTSVPRGHSLSVDAKTWGRLEERRRAEFKDTRALASWAARLVLALPVGVAGLAPEAQEELFIQMRQWAETKGLR